MNPANRSPFRTECLLSVLLLCLPALPGFGRNDPAPVAPSTTPGLVLPVPSPADSTLKLTAPDKESKAQSLRERKGAKKEILSPAERERRRRELRDRLQHRLETLKKKQKEGPLSPEEQKQLGRLEEISKRFQNQKKDAPPPAPDLK